MCTAPGHVNNDPSIPNRKISLYQLCVIFTFHKLNWIAIISSNTRHDYNNINTHTHTHTHTHTEIQSEEIIYFFLWLYNK